jgi:hypothetical protein
MGIHVFSSNKKRGVHTNKIDPEPYFERWEACLPIASKDQAELIGQPCYKHKTCGHLVKVPHSRIPPVVCTWCNVNTIVEQKQIEEYRSDGIEVFDAPQEIINLKKETFSPNRIVRYLRER